MSLPALAPQVDYARGVSDAWSRVALFLPKLLAFLVILIVGLILAKVIAKAISAILERVGFDRVVERGGIKQALSRSKYDAAGIVAKLVYYALVLLVLELAFGVFGPDNPIVQGLGEIIGYLPRLAVALVIIVLTAFVAKAVKDIVTSLIGGLSYGSALATASSVAILTIGLFAALDQLQIAPRIVTGLFYGLLAAAVGIAIVAVGGGGIRAMSSQWERALGRVQEEGPRMREHVQANRGQSGNPYPSDPMAGTGSLPSGRSDAPTTTMPVAQPPR